MADVAGGDCEEAHRKMRAEFEQELEKRTAALVKSNQEYLRKLAQCEKTENALKESEAKYRILIEEAGDVVYASDFNGFFTYVNPACAKMTGYTREELICKNFAELVAPEWRERVVAFYADQFKQRKSETLFSFPILTKSQELKWVEQTVVQLTEGDTVTGYRSIVRDITERKDAEALLIQKSAELEKSVALLEAANRELESFSYSVSHDLRAPIRAILGFSAMVKQEYGNLIEDKGVAYLDSIARSARRMGALIDDMLSFIRLGRRDIKRTQVDMTALANEAVQEAQRISIEKYNPTIIVRELPAIYCDHHLMLQVFVNLVSNALKYSNMRPEPVIEIGARTDRNMHTYYVKDNGMGFDMQYYNKLFGLFQRLQGIEDFSGTGIGLATVKKIVTRHGGTVSAEGKVDGGATFYVSLPIEEPGDGHPSKGANESQAAIH